MRAISISETGDLLWTEAPSVVPSPAEILIDVKELSSSVKLEDIVIDGIRFGLVTFLCTTINDLQHTELKSPGQIKIIVNSPAWEFWCKKMNEFSYERYPLGSIIE